MSTMKLSLSEIEAMSHSQPFLAERAANGLEEYWYLIATEYYKCAMDKQKNVSTPEDWQICTLPPKQKGKWQCCII